MKAATIQKLLLAQGVPFEKAKIVAQRVGTDTPAPGKGWSKGAEFVPRQACAVCGKPFYAEPKRLRKGRGRFCSRKCKGIGTSGAASHLYKEPATLTCPVCGESFTRPPSHAARGRVCSRECAGKWRTLKARERRAGEPLRQPIPRQQRLPRAPCIVCGTEVSKGSTKFCSRACYSRGRRGANNPTWKGGPLVDATCASCGNAFKANRFDVAKGYGKFCSRRCAAREILRRANPSYSKGKGGRREDLGGRYFRSRWEANWARYLNWKQEKGVIARWEFEVDTFEFPVKRGSKFYTPDFKVFDKDGTFVYHEVKGYMDQVSATKLKRMRIHYPNVRVVVIDRTEYKRIAGLIGPMLPNWETDTSPHRGKKDRW